MRHQPYCNFSAINPLYIGQGETSERVIAEIEQIRIGVTLHSCTTATSPMADRLAALDEQVCQSRPSSEEALALLQPDHTKADIELVDEQFGLVGDHPWRGHTGGLIISMQKMTSSKLSILLENISKYGDFQKKGWDADGSDMTGLELSARMVDGVDVAST